MTFAAPSTAYEQTQFDDNFPPGVEAHYWVRARNDAIDRTLRKAMRCGWVEERSRLLEVGCGTGIVVAAMRERGHDVRGVEIGHPPRTLAPDAMVTGTAAADLPMATRTAVDAVLMFDVLEHVPEDVAFLADTLRAMPRARTVVVTVPACPALWSEHDRHYGHFRRYTRSSLRQTLGEAGLTPRSTRYMFRTLFAAAAFIKATGQERDPVMRAPAGGPLHPVLAGILMAEDRMFGALPIPGLSLIAIATRDI